MKTIFAHLFFIYILTFIGNSAYAINPERWTLEACMQYAVENSPDVARQNARNMITRENYREALANLFPSVNVGSSGELSFGRAIDPETNTYNDMNTFYNSYQIYSSLTLFSGLSAINQLRIQKINRITGKHQLQYQQDIVAYETMEAFFKVQYAQDVVGLAEQQLENSVKNREKAERMFELGLQGVPDVAEMMAKEASDRYYLTQSRNSLTIAVILLKEKMNLPLDQDFNIEPYLLSDVNDTSVYSVADVFEQATESLPRALIAESTLQAQEFQFKATKGGLAPTLSMDAGMNTSFVRYSDREFLPYNEQLRGKWGSYVGLSLSMPLFSGLSRSGSVRRGKQTLTIARIDRNAAFYSIYREIEQAIADMTGQAEAYNQAVNQRKAIVIAHALNERKYAEGLLSALELHTSANRLMQALIEEKNAIVTYYMTQRLVKYYNGESFIPEE